MLLRAALLVRAAEETFGSFVKVVQKALLAVRHPSATQIEGISEPLEGLFWRPQGSPSAPTAALGDVARS